MFPIIRAIETIVVTQGAKPGRGVLNQLAMESEGDLREENNSTGAGHFRRDKTWVLQKIV
jgi:hypothetical protein